MVKDKKAFRLSKTLFWQLGLATVSLVCLSLLVKLWLSGGAETKDALESGRRLIIKIESGDIVGKYIADPDAPKPAPVLESSTPPAAMPATSAPAPKSASDTLSPDALPGPNPALSEKSADGMLPVIGTDGTKPWRYYAKPFDRKGDQPMIAIVVTGLGENKAVLEAALKLPGAVSLSFLPYAHDLDSFITAARASGHETMLDLPLEPGNYPSADPGPYALMTSRPAEENEHRLRWLMSRTQPFTGFVTPQNEVFSSNTGMFKGLLQALGSRGLLLVMGHEPAKSEVKESIESGNTAAVIADTLIDEELSPNAIQTRLTLLEEMAKKRGYAVGIAQDYPVTIEQLRLWADKLAGQGFALVPVSAIAHLRFS